MSDSITFLGLESSCDDTAAAVVRLRDGQSEILSSVVYGQAELHADFLKRLYPNAGLWISDEK